MAQIIRLPSGRHVLSTGKVLIGIRAQEPKRDQGTQAEVIQSLLLKPEPVIYLDNSLVARFMRAVDRLIDRAQFNIRSPL